MKRNPTVLTASSLLLAAINVAHAQYSPPPPPVPFPGFINDCLRRQDAANAVWDIGGSLRGRYEVKEGGLGLPPANDFRAVTSPTGRNDNDYFSTKLLTRIAYTDNWWGACVEGRSSMTVSDQRSATGAGTVPGPGGNGGPEQDGWVDLHQAYLTVGNPKEFPLSLKLGRQELSYGDERLVGAFAWNNLGRVFDAAKLRWQNSWFTADAFVSKLVLPDDNNFNQNADDNLFSGVHVSTKRLPKQLTEVYFFARNDEVGSASAANPGVVLPFVTPGPAARDIYTLGARLKSAPKEFGNIDYTLEGAYQFGSWNPTAVTEEDHRACAFVANVGYTLPDSSLTPRLALEYAFASGDSDPTDGRHETFENLYPTNHKFYGYMDFFSWQNLHDLRASFSIKPAPRFSLAVEGHLFWIAEGADNLYNAGGVPRTTPGSTVGGGDGFNRNPGYDRFVGSEIDLVAGYALNPFTAFETGYGHFFAGKYLDQTWSAVGGATDADWFYVQAVIRF